MRNYSEVINPVNVARLEVEWTSINPSSTNMNLDSRGTVNKPQQELEIKIPGQSKLTLSLTS